MQGAEQLANTPAITSDMSPEEAAHRATSYVQSGVNLRGADESTPARALPRYGVLLETPGEPSRYGQDFDGASRE